MNNRDASTKSSEGLAGATEQSASSGSQSVHDETAIKAVQQKNKTDVRVAGVQATQRINQVDVIGGAVAKEYFVDLGRSQRLQTVAKLAATAGNTEARLAAKRTAEELRLCLVGIGQENTNGGATGVRTGFHVLSSEHLCREKGLARFISEQVCREKGLIIFLGVPNYKKGEV